MHGFEQINVLIFAEIDRNTVADRAESRRNDTFRERSHPLRRPVIRVLRRYAVILQPLVGKPPEKICNERTCEHARNYSENIIKYVFHNN